MLAAREVNYAPQHAAGIDKVCGRAHNAPRAEGRSSEMQLIDTQAELEKIPANLGGGTRLYLDTEFDSSKAGKKLSLVQVSRDQPDTAPIYLVDALRLRDLSPLREVFAHPDVEWVLHAGLQDIELLVERLNITAPTKIFDTQIAWALLGPEASVSLSYLKFKVLGIRAGKPHQADDWIRRPLPESQLRYAASDIEHLPAIRSSLGDRAEALGRLGTIYQASREVAEPQAAPDAELSLSSFRNAWQLNRRTQAALRFLIQWYNARPTEERMLAPDTKTMMAIASRLPRTSADLARIKGVHRGWANRHGQRFTQLLVAATESAREEDFVPIDPPPYATFEEIRSEAWLGMARAEVCAELSVSPDLVFPGRLLKRVRDDLLKNQGLDRALEHLGGWRKELLSDALNRFGEKVPPPFPA